LQRQRKSARVRLTTHRCLLPEPVGLWNGAEPTEIRLIFPDDVLAQDEIGRAAKGAALFATAPARALGGAGINAWKTTTNLPKGLESATALTTYATRPLTWRPSRKKAGAPRPAPAVPPQPESTPEAEEENTMNDETSGSPRPQAKHIRSAHHLLRRAQSEPGAARHVRNIAKAAAQGHPGAQLAQAAIKEAQKQQRRPTPPPVFPATHRWGAFSSWAKGAA
jgi:hypothetical protein